MKRVIALWRLAAKSAWNRRGTLSLVVISVLLSTVLLLGIEKVRTQLHENFMQAVSGIDLIVGGRGGDLELLLCSIFHLGNVKNAVPFASVEKLSKMPEVSFVVPISLGDSHQGFAVLATTAAFFQHAGAEGRALRFARGKEGQDIFSIALGSEVAKKLGYTIGSKITLSHGMGEDEEDMHGIEASHHHGQHAEHHGQHSHANMPFTVTGILAQTATPLDRTLIVSLAAMEALHLTWHQGTALPNVSIVAHDVTHFDLTPKQVSACLLGVKNKRTLLALKHTIGEDRDDALMAILPAVAMDELWKLLGSGERILVLISWLVTYTGLAGLAAVILAGLGERRRELAILRSVGARPLDIFSLLVGEGLLIVGSGILAGALVVSLLIYGLAPFLAEKFGFFIHVEWPTLQEWRLLGAILLAGLLTSLLPALRAYKMSLADGLSINR